MQKIIPHLWFDTKAVEAAEFYTSIFPDSQVNKVSTLHGTPSGDCDVVTFSLMGHDFQAISAGPYFTFNPSISFMVSLQSAEIIDQVWEQLMAGGKALMPLDTYSFAKKYGWVQDKYGLTWQLTLADSDSEPRSTIMPSLIFVGDVWGKAAAARDFYVSVFKDSEMGMTANYPEGMEPDQSDTLMYGDFKLFENWFAVMDSAREHGYAFNEAVSLIVNCNTQDELDYYWSQLSAVPEAEQCGWLKDKYGVSWQVLPSQMQTLMDSGTQEQIDAMTQTLLPMKKLKIDSIVQAFDEAK